VSAWLFAVLLPLVAVPAAGAGETDPLQGYPGEVGARAARVVAAAAPGNGRVLAEEVRALRKAMLARGIVSINALPDIVFRRAEREGWAGEAEPVLRALATVSALSVPLWAWLVKEDAVHLRIGAAVDDAAALAGAVRRFGPALVGYAAWALSYFSAAACWFAVWAGAALFLRSRSCLEHDLWRAAGKRPAMQWAAPALVALLFVAPLAAGAGVGCAVPFWLLFAVPYARTREVVLLSGVLILLGAVVAAGGAVESLSSLSPGNAGAGWLGADGFAPVDVAPAGRSERAGGGAAYWVERFARARVAMQKGESAAAEREWTVLAAEGKQAAAVLNNRGIVRAQQGRRQEALADFEEAAGRDPGHPPALWNLYQMYLARFQIERARLVQPLAWERLQAYEPFRFRPAELDPGEWIASPVPLEEVWRDYLAGGAGWFRAAESSASLRRLFAPLGPRAALWTLAAVLAAGAAARAWAWKAWVSCACRACGAHLMVSGSREKADLCAACRSQAGVPRQEGPERRRRLAEIAAHRRFVRVVSAVVPGAGLFWAGQEGRAVVLGALLALALGAVSASTAAVRAGGALVVALQGSVRLWSAGAALVLWVTGAAWGAWAFAGLERRCRLHVERGG